MCAVVVVALLVCTTPLLLGTELNVHLRADEDDEDDDDEDDDEPFESDDVDDEADELDATAACGEAIIDGDEEEEAEDEGENDDVSDAAVVVGLVGMARPTP